jgi:SAM-dependent methyltransferase
MSELDGRLVRGHYDHGAPATAIVDAILDGLRAAGQDVDRLTWRELEQLDQFHAGGGAATMALAELAAIGPGDRLLDVGGGLGGSARALAATFGCRVTVVDLTESYTRVGEALTGRMGLDDLVTFRVGNALDLPFDTAGVDVAWTQHSTMNIADKERLYAELHRVVRPGGRLAMHEIVAGEDGRPLLFPVPWAAGPEISFLRPASAMRATITAAGFQETAWKDVTRSALEWMRERAAAAAGAAFSDRPPLAQDLLLGPGFADALRSIRRNLEEGRAVVVQGVFARP